MWQFIVPVYVLSQSEDGIEIRTENILSRRGVTNEERDNVAEMAAMIQNADGYFAFSEADLAREDHGIPEGIVEKARELIARNLPNPDGSTDVAGFS